MDSGHINLTKQLKINRLSLTKSRIQVFDYLLSHGPLTMHDLLMGLEGTLDRASVYRNVKLFESIGMLQRLTNGFKYSLELSDSLIAHHHHLVCISCGSISDISANKLEQYIAAISKTNNFRPKSHQVEVRGYCQGCQI